MHNSLKSNVHYAKEAGMKTTLSAIRHDATLPSTHSTAGNVAREEEKS